MISRFGSPESRSECISRKPPLPLGGFFIREDVRVCALA